MLLEKKARVSVRGHVSSFARIFCAIFSFFFASSQNFDKEDTKTRTQEEEEDFCLTDDDDD